MLGRLRKKFKRIFFILLFISPELLVCTFGEAVFPFYRRERRIPQNVKEDNEIREGGGRFASGLQRFLMSLTANKNPVNFMLFTKRNPDLMNMELLQPRNATSSFYFDGDKDTKIIVHDFMQSCADPMIVALKDAYLRKPDDFNVLIVDWAIARTHSYTVAATVTEQVGKKTAEMLNEMLTNYKKLHIIGVGLGAHVAGVAGNNMKGYLGRITGLDPSISLFRRIGKNFRLDSEDARFVDVIHTDSSDNFWLASHIGNGEAIGHVDFYPNEGVFQPGCPTSSIPTPEELQCSHIRALEIFKESVEVDNYMACRCSNWLGFINSRCNCYNARNLIRVGESCPKEATGRFFFLTRKFSPYGIGLRGAIPSMLRRVTTTAKPKKPSMINTRSLSYVAPALAMASNP